LVFAASVSAFEILSGKRLKAFDSKGGQKNVIPGLNKKEKPLKRGGKSWEHSHADIFRGRKEDWGELFVLCSSKKTKGGGKKGFQTNLQSKRGEGP